MAVGVSNGISMLAKVLKEPEAKTDITVLNQELTGIKPQIVIITKDFFMIIRYLYHMSGQAEIARLKRFFSDIKLPEGNIDMGFFRISNIEHYLDTCFIRLEKNHGNPWFESNFKMLQRMEQYFLNQPNIVKGA